MGATAKRLGIRITDGCIFPYTDLTAKQSDMRPWTGPMDLEWTRDTREARRRRLKYLEEDHRGFAEVTPRKAFNIATADKEELLEHVANEYGETLDARLPVLILRRQALALANKQLEELEAAEARKNATAVAVEPPATAAAVEPAEIAAPAVAPEPEPVPRPTGLKRRAA